MKYLFLCEGPNERTIINLLLDAKKLKITRDDLIGLGPYHARQLSNPTIKSNLKIYGDKVIVYRIGDTQRDKFIIPNDLKNIVSKDKIFKYCTKPEFEILLIINENLFDKLKKSTVRPKIFAKENIKYNKKKYDQSENFIIDYYSGKRINMLVENLKKYKKLNKKHNKDELYLADLLK